MTVSLLFFSSLFSSFPVSFPQFRLVIFLLFYTSSSLSVSAHTFVPFSCTRLNSWFYHTFLSFAFLSSSFFVFFPFNASHVCSTFFFLSFIHFLFFLSPSVWMSPLCQFFFGAPPWLFHLRSGSFLTTSRTFSTPFDNHPLEASQISLQYCFSCCSFSVCFHAHCYSEFPKCMTPLLPLYISKQCSLSCSSSFLGELIICCFFYYLFFSFLLFWTLCLSSFAVRKVFFSEFYFLLPFHIFPASFIFHPSIFLTPLGISVSICFTFYFSISHFPPFSPVCFPSLFPYLVSIRLASISSSYSLQLFPSLSLNLPSSYHIFLLFLHSVFYLLPL